jgi:hypothetical protein
METGVAKAVAEFIKNPEAVSKKTEEAIKHLGVGPNRHSVKKLVAQVVAYRIESRKTNDDSAAGLLYQKGVPAAVRASRLGGEVRGPALRHWHRLRRADPARVFEDHVATNVVFDMNVRKFWKL